MNLIHAIVALPGVAVGQVISANERHVVVRFYEYDRYWTSAHPVSALTIIHNPNETVPREREGVRIMLTKSAWSWTMIQQFMHDDSQALYDRIEHATYGYDGSDMIPLSLTEAQLETFNDTLRRMPNRLRTVIDAEGTKKDSPPSA